MQSLNILPNNDPFWWLEGIIGYFKNVVVNVHAVSSFQGLCLRSFLYAYTYISVSPYSWSSLFSAKHFLPPCLLPYSFIWNFWTSLKGNLSLKVRMTPGTFTNRSILHGHYFAYFLVSFSTVFLQRSLLSITTVMRQQTEWKWPFPLQEWPLATGTVFLRWEII